MKASHPADSGNYPSCWYTRCASLLMLCARWLYDSSGFFLRLIRAALSAYRLWQSPKRWAIASLSSSTAISPYPGTSCKYSAASPAIYMSSRWSSNRHHMTVIHLCTCRVLFHTFLSLVHDHSSLPLIHPRGYLLSKVLMAFWGQFLLLYPSNSATLQILGVTIHESPEHLYLSICICAVGPW